MNKLIKLVAVGVLVVSLAHAGWKPRKPWLLSVALVVAASVADASSSYGANCEGNPLLRSRDGRLGARGVGIKFGLVGGLLASEVLLIRWRLEVEPVVTGSNLAVAGLIGGVAARNYRIRGK